MNEQAIRIRVEGADPAESVEYAQDLLQTLREQFPHAHIESVRTDTSAQNVLGTLLIVTKFTVEVAVLVLHLREWWRKKPGASLSAEDGTGKQVPIQPPTTGTS